MICNAPHSSLAAHMNVVQAWQSQSIRPGIAVPHLQKVLSTILPLLIHEFSRRGNAVTCVSLLVVSEYSTNCCSCSSSMSASMSSGTAELCQPLHHLVPLDAARLSCIVSVRPCAHKFELFLLKRTMHCSPCASLCSVFTNFGCVQGSCVLEVAVATEVRPPQKRWCRLKAWTLVELLT